MIIFITIFYTYFGLPEGILTFYGMGVIVWPCLSPSSYHYSSIYLLFQMFFLYVFLI